MPDEEFVEEESFEGEEALAEEMPMDEEPAPMGVEVTIPVAEFPGIEAVAPGESLTVVSNDGEMVVLSLAPVEEGPPVEGGELGEGGAAIAGEF